MVDVDVTDPNRRKKTRVRDFEDVAVDEDRREELDENTDWMSASNDCHGSSNWNWHYWITVHNDLAYLLKNDILSPLYLSLSTQNVWRSFLSG